MTPMTGCATISLQLDPAPAATLTVLPRTLTVTPTNRSKVYGVALTSADFAGNINGIQNGDNITATYDSPLGDPATAAVGTYDINATLSDPDGMLPNYALVNNVGILTVTQRDLVVTSDSQTKIYGDIFSAFTGSIVGLQNGDNITLAFDSLGSPAAALVGVYPINITLIDQVPAKLGNYHVIQNVGTLAVTQRALVITPDNQTKVYGDTFTAFTGTVDGIQNGDAITPVYSSPGAINTATVAGSPYPITVTLNDPGGKLGNYSYTLNSGTLTVTLRDLMVTPDDKSKVYGQWFTNFTGVITGIQNGENISANYASTGSLPTAVVGTYPITSTLNDPTGKLGNYNVIQVDGTLTVTSLVLTVRADNKTIAYGDPDPAFSYIYSGFMGTDTAADIDTPPTCTVLADPHTAVGTYPIVCSGAADNNYSFAYVDGTLTVTRRALVVTPIDKIKTYGNLFTAFTGTITGIQNGETITAVYDSLGAPVTAAVGDYPITATLTAAAGVLDNYTVTLNTGTLSVIQRDLVVTPDNKSKLYGDLFTLFTGTVNGVQNADPITVTYASTGAAATATVTAPGPTYPITATLNAPAGVLANYNITLNQGSLTVNQRPLIVTPDNKAKIFGTVFPAASFTGVVTGIQAGDIITVAYDSTGAPAAAAVGTYPITATLTDPGGKLPNYAVTLNQGTLTVGLSVLTVTANNQTITYGDPDPAFTFTYTGFVNGETAAVIDVLPSCTVAGAHVNIGTYPILCSGGVDDNYAFSYVAGTLTVNPRALTVTPANKTKIYGDLFTAFTGTVVGLQGGDGITVSYDSLGAPATAAIGTYPITAALDDPNTRLGNYIVTLNTGTLTVTSARPDGHTG